MSLQIVRDWVLRFNVEGRAGLLDRKAPGQPPLLQAEHRTALAAAVEAGPRPYLDGVVRWRLVDLVQWLWERFGLSVSRQTLGRELRAMGYTYAYNVKALRLEETRVPEYAEKGCEQFAAAWRRRSPREPSVRRPERGG